MTSQLGPLEDRIDILLATYNGERFLAQQLDSIVAQTHKNWRILARDDGSSDGTMAILKAYQACLGEKLKILEDDKGNLGLVGNFSTLMEASTAPYAAFCDQDDVWLPEKLTLGVAVVKDLENRWGGDMPCLSFSDLEIVDTDLNQIAPSFWNYENLAATRADQLSRLLARNTVTGCTTIINRNLVTLAAPIPSGIILHDWWLALVAAAFGRVEAVPKATVKYRQHRGNDIGARRYRPGYFVIGFFKFLFKYIRNRTCDHGIFSHYLTHYKQADTFYKYFGLQLTIEQQKLISNFLDIPNRWIFSRAILLSVNGILPRGFFNKIAFICLYNNISMGLANIKRPSFRLD